MGTFVSIFLNNILPAFLIIGTGVLLDRKFAIDRKSISRIAIYVLLPCLVFTYLIESTVDPRQFVAIILFVIAIGLAMSALGLGVGHALCWPARRIDALMLSVAFLNSGNFGLSIIAFAFGDKGLEFGAICYIASHLMFNTLGAFIAARSNGSGSRKALMEVFKLPGLYAFVLAILLRAGGITIPAPLFKAISLVSRAAVPTMLLMLGFQLSQSRIGKQYKDVAIGAFMRLVVGALVAIGLAPLLGLQGLARQVAIIEGSTPTAVNSVLLAVQFDADSEYVSNVVFITTLLSGITLTILLAWLT